MQKYVKITRPKTRRKPYIKSLREDKNIIILRADKGNSKVVMDRSEYDNNIEGLKSDTKNNKMLPNQSSRYRHSNTYNFQAIYVDDTISIN